MGHVVFVGLGSNLNEPQAQLKSAFDDLNNLPGTRLLNRSSLYRSAPIGYIDQPNFVNAVAKIVTDLAPKVLLRHLLNIEEIHGRKRTFVNAPRTLDLDLLLYDDLQMHEHGLTIPHPQMHLRAFVLRPLLEISPNCHIPQFGHIEDVLQACQSQVVERIEDI